MADELVCTDLAGLRTGDLDYFSLVIVKKRKEHKRLAKKRATVYFVGAGPGDPELITVKGRRILEAADIVIYAGSLVNPALLAGLKAEVYDSAHMTLDEIVGIMKGAAEKGCSSRGSTREIPPFTAPYRSR